ncbi:bifunctional glutamate N-acetyltransferase/amino-acid acetyltransferase ArgJ [Sutcliffiella halmapala]|uniref:bifunctional glutamate N-acetyltransferase/amino-acid acetyltransferase ArgJ n=1 Tax=Sutcliffiella halmapala TaxID=79882 RepID=UPI000995B6B1|nr:bifunctional glutamate N-acetyltransferase/amino-acid acetyltransferase ArgJ [Sutcliffiella halmapala]
MNAHVITNIKNQWAKVEGGNICTPKGFTAGGLHCGIKRKRKDLGWIYCTVPANAAAVYTTNLFQAPPLKVTQESLKSNGILQGLIVNSGNANSCTGEEGMQHAYNMRNTFAEQFNIAQEDVGVISTGVIGEQLPINKIIEGIHNISYVQKEVDGLDFEQSILTTDTFTKNACVKMKMKNKEVTIAGAAKGSGMVHPNMATMLGFITTDVNIDQAVLQTALKSVTKESFNMITVDGDTSTNDMVVVMASGLAGNEVLIGEDEEYQLFLEGLKEVSLHLAKQIARDGEGATKLIEVTVDGALTDTDAQTIAKTIVGSSLVKTAIFGEDANWGRIVSAVGYSGVQLNPNLITVAIGPIKVVENGLPLVFSEANAKVYLENEEIKIYVHIGAGNAMATAWGCDLSYDYVRINASYRT